METPCISVCIVNKHTGLCEGCGRSVPEIARWASMTPAERRRIMSELPARMKAAVATPGR
jgi:hypothetical protein